MLPSHSTDNPKSQFFVPHPPAIHSFLQKTITSDVLNFNEKNVTDSNNASCAQGHDYGSELTLIDEQTVAE